MKKRLLITGGTVFISRFIADYFSKKDFDIFVLNRNTRKQVNGVTLICADRNNLGDTLKDYYFDAVIDVCAYNLNDIKNLLKHLGNINDYIFISSSSVYPEINNQPFNEQQIIGPNKIWGQYGTDKIAAEEYLLSKIPSAYILRPPYLYGPMQNLYREPFIFDCALQNRTFYVPKYGKMKLQFFHVEDLCRIIELILNEHPKNHIFNVGNEESVDINTFVDLCYKVVGTKLNKIYVTDYENQRDYFSFYDYEYILDVSKQSQILPQTKDLYTGLQESFDWYIKHQDNVIKKDYIQFIDNNFIDTKKEDIL